MLKQQYLVFCRLLNWTRNIALQNYERLFWLKQVLAYVPQNMCEFAKLVTLLKKEWTKVVFQKGFYTEHLWAMISIMTAQIKLNERIIGLKNRTHLKLKAGLSLS